MDQGVLTPQEARIHPRKNILLRAVGTDASVSPDILEGEVLYHDIFLLCSDGLTDMVEDCVIQRILGSAAPLQQKADGLIEAALVAGGSDNVTVVLCQAEMSNHELAPAACGCTADDEFMNKRMEGCFFHLPPVKIITLYSAFCGRGHHENSRVSGERNFAQVWRSHTYRKALFQR